MLTSYSDPHEASIPSRAPIEPLAPITELWGEYENGSIAFAKRADWFMENGLKHVGRTRGMLLFLICGRAYLYTYDSGDGDCFYFFFFFFRSSPYTRRRRV